MKSKKLIGTMAAAFIVCAVLAFNFLVFPRVLAASPGDSEIETITPENNALWEEPDEQPGEASQPDEPEITPDINAISKEQAIEIAKNFVNFQETTIYEYKGAVQIITTAFYDARYLESADPASDPSWFVLVSESHTGEKYEWIPVGYTPDEYLAMHQDRFEASLGTDSDGLPVVILACDWTAYGVIEVNAITGECGQPVEITRDESTIEKAFYGDDLRQTIIRETLPGPAEPPEIAD